MQVKRFRFVIHSSLLLTLSLSEAEWLTLPREARERRSVIAGGFVGFSLRCCGQTLSEARSKGLTTHTHTNTIMEAQIQHLRTKANAFLTIIILNMHI